MHATTARYRDNTRWVPSVTLFDMRLGYQFGQRWELAVDARNLFDKEYLVNCSYGSCNQTAAPIIEMLWSITVIWREEMAARGVQEVVDVVRHAPATTANVYAENRDWEAITSHICGVSSTSNRARSCAAIAPARSA